VTGGLLLLWLRVARAVTIAVAGKVLTSVLLSWLEEQFREV
jgi:hypothetical protein